MRLNPSSMSKFTSGFSSENNNNQSRLRHSDTGLSSHALNAKNIAHKYRRILFGGNSSRPVDEEEITWTYEDSLTMIGAEMYRGLVSRRREHLKAVQTFLPRILQQRPEISEGKKTVMHSCDGCVVFSDASGFTKLTETLAQKADGAEVLSKCLNKFFTPLIDIIEAYRGDVIKFSGDALSILFEATDDYKLSATPCGSRNAPRKTPFQLACLRGAACCLEIHKRLHNFDTGEGGVHLTLHIGVGAGRIVLLQVGGEFNRYEYVIAGTPMQQIAIAEPLAGSGETVLSPAAWDDISDFLIEGEPLTEGPPGYHRMVGLDTRLHTYPTVKQASMECNRIDYAQRKSMQESLLLDVSAHFIPRSILKHLKSGNSSSINEMRSVTIIFVQIGGVDVSTDQGSKVAQKLMVGMQRACYTNEGNLNKFLVDDKGLLFLFVFGLPPLMHIDDPTRAIRACFDMANFLKSMGLVGHFGVTTGRVFCGIVGSDRRREYTVMGDTVNLSARLMAKAPANSVLIDQATHDRSSQDVLCKKIEPFMVKGKANLIHAYEPVPPQLPSLEVPQLAVVLNHKTWPIGFAELAVPIRSNGTELQEMKVRMPWRTQSERFGGASPLLKMTRWRELQRVDKALQAGLLVSGGCLSLLGASGTGKTELSEYIISRALASELVPIFGFMNARSAERWRAAAEVLQTSIRMVLGSKANKDPGEAAEALLLRIVGTDNRLHKVLGFFGFESFEVPGERSSDRAGGLSEQELEDGVAEVCERLILEVARSQGVCLFLRVRRGTDLMNGLHATGSGFATLALRLVRLGLTRQKDILGRQTAGRRGSNASTSSNASPAASTSEGPPLYPILVVVVSRSKLRKMAEDDTMEESNSELAKKERSILRLSSSGVTVREITTDALTEDAAVELMCLCLGVSTVNGGSLVKRKLREFVSAVSINIPTYIQECVRHLILERAVVISNGECTIAIPDLNAVNIAEWVQTSMVGGTISQLESLKSAQSHIMKLATIFEGPFSPLDLSAANRALFGGLPRYLALHDMAKLLGACKMLVANGFLRSVPRKGHPDDKAHARMPRWTISNSLFRKVAGATVLNSQRILIKRSALLERALNYKLPARVLPRTGLPASHRGNKPDELAATRAKFTRNVDGENIPFEVKCTSDNTRESLNVLVAACVLGSVQMVVEVLKSGQVDINKGSEASQVPLLIGGRRNYMEVSGYTPLHYAASGGEVEVVHILCEHSAQVNAKCSTGETPLMIAAQMGHLETVQYLCEAQGALQANNDVPDLWERVLPPIHGPEDIPLPLAPAFMTIPIQNAEAATVRRQRVMSWLVDHVSATEAKITLQVGGLLTSASHQWSEEPQSQFQSLKPSENGTRRGNNSRNASKTAKVGFTQGSGLNLGSHHHQQGERRASCASGASSGSTSTAGRKQGQNPTSPKTKQPVTPISAIRALVPAKYRNAAIRTKIRLFLTRGRIWLLVSVIALFVALFLPDCWVLTGAPTSTGADVILMIVMLLFLFELIMLTLVDSSYPLSFFFFMDIIGTISMISDISFFLGPDATQENESLTGDNNLTLFRATRTAKIGARAGRLSRLVKVMRFLPGIGVSRGSGEEGEKLRQIQNQLTNVLSKRVACLTILLVIVMPLCSIGTYPEGDFSKQAFVESLWRRAGDVKAVYQTETCTGLADGVTNPCEVAWEQYRQSIFEFGSFYKDQPYGPYKVCIDESDHPLEGCWDISSEARSFEPTRKSFRLLVRSNGLISIFDWAEPTKSEARVGLVLITLVIVLMCGACTLLNYSASELAVRPLERMLTSIKNSAKAIFSSCDAIGAAEDDDEFGPEMGSEVALLERVVKKIATLAELSQKKNPWDEADLFGMKNEELGVFAMTHASGVFNPNAASHEIDGQVNGRTEISVTMQWQLEEIGIDYQVLLSWQFNVLTLETVKLEKIAFWMLMNNPGSSNWTENYVEGKKLREFVSRLASKYLDNRYHNFMHALDVSHSVFRYLSMVQADAFLSMLDQFALLVAAIAHDVGHFGMTNGFLIETQHELAVLYNDKSPLENMHCSRLFEILAEAPCNIFTAAEASQFKECRKLIIDAILHTDITQHPAMVKNLELLFEMNSKVLSRADAMASGAPVLSDGEIEIFSAPENKRLIQQTLLHGADIANPAKPWAIAYDWAHRVLDEYAQQGDQEKALGIPVQVLNDRDKVNRPNSQVGFIEFLVTPFIVAKVRLFRGFAELPELLEGNLLTWERVWAEESNPNEAEREKVRERVEKICHSLQSSWEIKELADSPTRRRRSVVAGSGA